MPSTADAHVAAWRSAVVAFSAFGHVFETARSGARLVPALRAAGALDEAEAVHARALAVARSLGAAPLVRELRAPATARASAAGTPALTEREQEVLSLVAQGRSNREVGLVLFISAKTVTVHVCSPRSRRPAGPRRWPSPGDADCSACDEAHC